MPKLVVTLLLIAGAAGAGVTAWALQRVGVAQGYAPVQPIAFSHALHAGEYQIPCLYCHYGAEKSRHAGIPALSVCMNCHAQLKAQTIEIAKLKEAVAQKRPIAWVKVHNLPDFVYFNHARHVVVGGLDCTTCHGPVKTMERLRQHASLTMGWCLDCHREKATAELAELSGAAAAARTGSSDCAKCHY